MSDLDPTDTTVPDPAVVLESATTPEPSAFGETEPAPEKPYVPESAMAVYAHPDDVEFSCSGTLAQWARKGARVSIILCTSGSAMLTKDEAEAMGIEASLVKPVLRQDLVCAIRQVLDGQKP